MKINPPIIKYLAALIIGSVISPTCSNVCYMQVQKIYLFTPVKPGGIFNTSYYHSELLLKSVISLGKVVGNNLKITVIVPPITLLTGTIQ